MLRKDIESVIDWNAFSLDGVHDFSEEKISLQRSFVADETDETIAAIRSGDVIGLIDGLCDIFVTSIYYEFIRSSRYRHHMSIMGLLYVAGSGVYRANGNFIEDHVFMIANDKSMNSSFKLITSIYKSLYNQVDFHSFMKSVTDSNWSKFPVLSNLPHSTEDECQLIESVCNCRGVKAKISKKEDIEHVIFRDFTGKIRKPPSSFFDPLFEESEIDKMSVIMGYCESRTVIK